MIGLLAGFLPNLEKPRMKPSPAWLTGSAGSRVFCGNLRPFVRPVWQIALAAQREQVSGDAF